MSASGMPAPPEPLRLTVRVRPGASRTRVGGRWNQEALIVAVSAPAVDGRANEAVCQALAEAFGVRPRHVRIRSGATARTKGVEIDDPGQQLAARLNELLER